jgi:hypothetical protein
LEVRYYSFDNSAEEWVSAERIREVARPAYPIGATVEINWKKVVRGHGPGCLPGASLYPVRGLQYRVERMGCAQADAADWLMAVCPLFPPFRSFHVQIS